MRVFLANAPWHKEGRVGVRAGSRWPFTMPKPGQSNVPLYLPFPFYLAYAAALLKREGVEVMLLDGVAEGLEYSEFARRVKECAPDLLVMETSTPSFNSDVEIALNLRPDVGSIVFCGPHASFNPVEVLEGNSHIDYVLLGEYECGLLNLVRARDEGRSLREVKGLVFRENGSAVHNGKQDQLENVDYLPWPAREFLPMASYRDEFAGMPQPSLQMWASRGCPYTCIFCLWPHVMYEPRSYRPRNPADVAEEMAYCVRTYGMKSVFFDDDTFNVGKPRLLKLAEEITKREINVPWAMMARADLVDAPLLAALRTSGLFAAKYGVESGNQDIVTNSKKNLDLRKAEAGIRLTKEHDIKVHLTFSFGLPGETWDTVRQTIDYALRMDPETLQFSINTPFPGTPYYDIARNGGMLEIANHDEFDGWKSSVLHTSTMTSSELEDALRIARETWDRWTFRRQVRRDPVRGLLEAIRHPRRAFKAFTASDSLVTV